MGLLGGSPVGGGGGGSSFSSLTEDADGHVTHQPSTDATDAAVFQNAAGQNLLETDTANGEVVVRRPGGTAEEELQISVASGDVAINHPKENRGFFFQVNGAGVFAYTGGAFFSPQTSTLGRSQNLWSTLYTESAVKDGNDNELLGFGSNANAVNYLQVGNAASGNAPTALFTGDDTDVDGEIATKGTGALLLHGSTTQPGTSGSPAVQIGNAGAGFFINGSGEIVAVDEAGNTTTIS